MVWYGSNERQYFNLHCLRIAKTETLFMLEKLQSLAQRLSWTAPWCLMLAIAGLGLAVSALFLSASEAGDVRMIPGVLLFVWGLMARSFLQLFARVPARPAAGAGIVTRIKAALRRSVYYIFLCLFALA